MHDYFSVEDLTDSNIVWVGEKMPIFCLNWNDTVMVVLDLVSPFILCMQGIVVGKAAHIVWINVLIFLTIWL